MGEFHIEAENSCSSSSFMLMGTMHCSGPPCWTQILRDALLSHSQQSGKVPMYSVPNQLGKVFVTSHTYLTCIFFILQEKTQARGFAMTKFEELRR